MKQVNKTLSTILYVILFFIIICSFNIQAFASADNSLSFLKIDGVDLSPKFKYNRLKYTGTLNSNDTKVNIKTKTSNRRAKVISISGNTNLKDGLNKIKIVVQAQNKRKAIYEIALTKIPITDSNDNISDNNEETEQPDVLNDSVDNNDNNVDNDLITADKNTKEKTKSKKEQIAELEKELENANTAYETLNTKYTDILKDNKDLQFKNNIFTILSILFFCLLLISLFIAVIKNNTKKYLDKEFQDFNKSKDSGNKLNVNEVLNEIYEIGNSDNSEYGRFTNKISIADDIQIDIKNKSSNKTPKEAYNFENKVDLYFDNMKDPYNKAENTEEVKNNNSETEEKTGKKDSFTFDIIDL